MPQKPHLKRKRSLWGTISKRLLKKDVLQADGSDIRLLDKAGQVKPTYTVTVKTASQNNRYKDKANANLLRDWLKSRKAKFPISEREEPRSKGHYCKEKEGEWP